MKIIVLLSLIFVAVCAKVVTLPQYGVINGAYEADDFGFQTAIGDINNDGINDIIISSPKADPPNRDMAGMVFVVYGISGMHFNLSLDMLHMNNSVGFRILGADIGDQLATSVTTADVNGDHILDIIISSEMASPKNRTEAGVVYIIYGQIGTRADVDLKTMTAVTGYRIFGAKAEDHFGRAVVGEDFNRDGTYDVAISAVYADSKNRSSSGEVYVINGIHGTRGDIDMLDSTVGYRVYGPRAGDCIGWSLDAGDINGDGIQDLIIGSPVSEVNNKSFSGRAFVLYGNTYEPKIFDLVDLNVQTGYIIHGADAEHHTAWMITSCDVNGDHINDVVLSADGATPYDRLQAGIIHVILGQYGTRGDVNLNDNSSTSFWNIFGADEKDNIGQYGLSCADLNADGKDDILIGVPIESVGDLDEAGYVAVVYGHNTHQNVDLLYLNDTTGFLFAGSKAFDRTGTWISVGDVNNDGIPDVMISSSDAEALDRVEAGFVSITMRDCGEYLPPAHYVAEPHAHNIIHTVIKMKCAVGYHGTPNNVTCQTNSYWTAVSGCYIDECPTYSAAPAGYQLINTCANMTYEGVCTVQCASGYSGTPTSPKCEAGGRWSKPAGCIKPETKKKAPKEWIMVVAFGGSLACLGAAGFVVLNKKSKAKKKDALLLNANEITTGDLEDGKQYDQNNK